MNRSHVVIKIKKSNYIRVLGTETLPFETPVIFSNDGLCDSIQNYQSRGVICRFLLDALVFGSLRIKYPKHSIPYTYRIRKGAVEYRKLSLIHPLSQWQIKELYQRYESLMVHYCSISPVSIRAPERVAGSYYQKNKWEDIHKYRSSAVSSVGMDRLTKQSPSFFAYRGHDRLYKFFSSRDFFELERRFQFLWTFDVSKCFDSIYTHSLSWAIKEKEFTKSHVTVKSTFAQQFDLVMQHANYSETNGIVIGPEVSRIFAELIFQQIDKRSLGHLKEYGGIVCGLDYQIRRYVDDVFLFAKSEEIAQKVYERYVDVLQMYNLHVNPAKSQRLTRPFITKQSKLIQDVTVEIDNFLEKVLGDEGSELTNSKRAKSRWRITQRFVDRIKAICEQNSAGYDASAGFIIAVVTERIKALAGRNIAVQTAEEEERLAESIAILVDVIYFLYEVAPSVNASYRVAVCIILLAGCSKCMPRHGNSVLACLGVLSRRLFSDSVRQPPDIDNFLNLEDINIVLALQAIGDEYILSEEAVRNIFLPSGRSSYFTLISCLYYIRDRNKFATLRKDVLERIDQKLSSMGDILQNTEKACLFLDMLSCPFVSKNKKNQLVRALFASLQQPTPSTKDMVSFLAESRTISWFVNWKELDLLNSLERKELKHVY